MSGRKSISNRRDKDRKRRKQLRERLKVAEARVFVAVGR